ncbi:MAG TPA: type II secretion system protein [Candidatus Acidoferrales bacterium]|nr:type II secretion system protein [Candidatus Acidoferrales bacterium]
MLRRPSKFWSPNVGMTLLELMIATGILLVLASAATPLLRITIKRQREAELHHALREMRDAIDRYRDAAEAGKFRTEQGSEFYPPDLDTLVNGVDMTSNAAGGLGAPNSPAGGPTFGTPPSSSGGASSAFGNNPAGVGSGSSVTMHVRFLRKIPVDPFTGTAEWNLQSVSDDPSSTSWGGKNVFDVHSKSQGTALNGTKYADW